MEEDIKMHEVNLKLSMLIIRYQQAMRRARGEKEAEDRKVKEEESQQQVRNLIRKRRNKKKKKDKSQGGGKPAAGEAV